MFLGPLQYRIRFENMWCSTTVSHLSAGSESCASDIESDKICVKYLKSQPGILSVTGGCRKPHTEGRVSKKLLIVVNLGPLYHRTKQVQLEPIKCTWRISAYTIKSTIAEWNVSTVSLDSKDKKTDEHGLGLWSNSEDYPLLVCILRPAAHT